MATKKQIDANRLNARKSTGPRSSEGKSRSSMNALTTGIHAESQVIYGEFEADLQALQREYYDRFQPTTPEQRMLIDSLIDSEWLLRRFRTCEAQLWDETSQQTNRPALGDAFRHNADSFSRLQRRVDAAHRNYRNALHELQQLQAEEAVEEEALTTQDNQEANPQNGFVPQFTPEPAAAPSPGNHDAPRSPNRECIPTSVTGLETLHPRPDVLGLQDR